VRIAITNILGAGANSRVSSRRGPVSRKHLSLLQNGDRGLLLRVGWVPFATQITVL